MKFEYENHKLDNKVLPFIFHNIRIDKSGGRTSALGNWHDNPEFLFFTEGKGQVIYNRDIYDVEAGNLVIVNTDSFHNIITDSTIEYYCLIVDLGFFEDNGIDINSIYFNPVEKNIDFGYLFEKISVTYQEKKELYEAKIRSYVLDIIISATEKYKIEHIEQVSFPTEIKRAITYIKENYTKSITVDDIVKHVGMSRAYFSRMFKKSTGMSMITYLNYVRCRQARKMFNSGLGIGIIAAQCGFENQSYFSKTYKKIMGKLPSEEV